MLAYHEQAVAQLMRTGRVTLRDRENGNLYVSDQRDGTYKILEWTDDVDYECERDTNRDGAFVALHDWCTSLEKFSRCKT